MLGSRTCAVGVIVASVLAACGGGGDEDAGSAVSSTVSPATVDTTAAIAPPTTEPETTTSTSTTTTTTTTSTTSTTTTPPTVPDENCLEGSWWLSPEATTNLYANLLPGFPVTVTGTHWVEFAGNTVDYWVVTEARFEVGGTDVTFGIDQHGVGTYAVVDDVLSMTYDTFESTIHEGHGVVITDPNTQPDTYANQAVDLVDDGAGTITINRVTVPVIELPPVAGGPVGCDDATMSLGFTSGIADTVAVYTRQA